MTTYPHLKRCLAAGLTLTIFAAIVLMPGLSCSRNAPVAPPPGKPGPVAVVAPKGGEIPKGGDAPKMGAQTLSMFGGGPSRNMVNTAAKGLPTTWSVEDGAMKNVKWFADLGSKSYAAPVISSGQIYVGTNNQRPRDKKYIKDGKPIDLGVLMCFGEADGKFLWQDVFLKLAAGRVQDWPLEGICSTPVVEGNRVYFVSNRCEVVCDSTDGKIIWKLDMIKDLGVFPHNLAVCSPLLVGDNLWVVTANGVDEGHINVPSPKAPSFLKLAKKDGKVLWQSNLPTVKLTEASKDAADEKDFLKRLVNKGELIQHGQWSNPAYAVVDGQPQVVFPGGDGWIYSFDPDGKLLWKFDCNPKDAEYELQGRGTRNDFIATPVIYDGKVYIGVGQDPEHERGVGHFWCIDMKKRGDVSPELADYATWPPKTKQNPSSALVWHYGGFAKPEDRKKIGRNYYFGRTISTCAIHDDLVYIAELENYLHCLDAKTGQVYWTHDTRSPLWSSPYWADNKIYLGTESESVFVFAHGKEKKLLAENEMGGRVSATPVAANGVLYIMTANKLYALANKKE